MYSGRIILKPEGRLIFNHEYVVLLVSMEIKCNETAGKYKMHCKYIH